MFRGPVCVVAALLGFSPAQGRAISELTADFVACLSPLSDQAQLDAAHVAAEQLKGYFIELLADPNNRSTLLAGIRQRFATSTDPQTLIANLIGLFSQTYDATAGLIGNALLALSRNPQIDSTQVNDLIAEVQRFDPPVQNTRRFVAAPCEIDGVNLNPGDVILVLLASANRDPQLNDDPDTFLLERPNRRSFTFGAGRHQCPGQVLALSIARATLTQILMMKPALDRLTWHYRPSLTGAFRSCLKNTSSVAIFDRQVRQLMNRRQTFADGVCTDARRSHDTDNCGSRLGPDLPDMKVTDANIIRRFKQLTNFGGDVLVSGVEQYRGAIAHQAIGPFSR